MNLFTLSWIYLKQKKSKSIVLGLILLLLGSALISLVSIRNSLSNKIINKQKKIIYLSSRDEEAWPEEAFNAIKNSDIINNVYAIREIQEKADVKYVSQKGIVNTSPSLTMVAYDDSENIKDLKEKRLSIIEGRTLTNEDDNKVLVHELFAKDNQLKIGSNIDIKENKLEVIGIFKPSKQNEVLYNNRNIENTIITNQKTINALYKSNGYSAIELTVKDAKAVEYVIKAIKQWGVDWSKFSVKSASELHGESYKNIVTVYFLVNRIIVLLSIFATTILVVILKRWINSRVKETGVLLAIGKSKMEIIVRYLVEVLMVGTLALGTSIPVGQVIGQKVFNTIMNQVGGVITSSSSQGSLLYIENFKNISINIGVQDIFILYFMGVTICIVAVVVSTYSIVRLKPREILTMMS